MNELPQRTNHVNMSSLLQFRGSISNGKVGLEIYLQSRRGTTIGKYELLEPEIPCPKCNKSHPQLYIVWRKPVGMWGCWVVFRYLGEEHVPDLSCPFSLDKLPRGAIKLDAQQNAEAWHKE